MRTFRFYLEESREKELFLPGSSRCVKCLGLLVGVFGVKRHTFYTLGRSRNLYIYTVPGTVPYPQMQNAKHFFEFDDSSLFPLTEM